MSDFVTFPKIKRLFRDIIVTEKIDGTNAQVRILNPHVEEYDPDLVTARVDGYMVLAGSRTRYVVPGNDNFGFAAWVREHAEVLVEALGEGTHYGEWWGKSIQRNYGLNHRRFSLFNISVYGFIGRPAYREAHNIPECIQVVPTLFSGHFSELAINSSLKCLDECGSWAAPGFKKPEGIVIFHTHSNSLHKVTLEGDQAKG